MILGVHARWERRLNDALKLYQLARQDSVWSERALHAIIQIYLNPSQGTWGGDAITTGLVESRDGKTAIHAAELLIKARLKTFFRNVQELPKCSKTEVYRAWVQIFLGQKDDLERATESLMKLVNDGREEMPALLVPNYPLNFTISGIGGGVDKGKATPARTQLFKTPHKVRLDF